MECTASLHGGTITVRQALAVRISKDNKQFLCSNFWELGESLSSSLDHVQNFLFFFVFAFLMDHGPCPQGPGGFSIPIPHVQSVATTCLQSFISPIWYSVPAGFSFKNHRQNKTNVSKYIKSPVSIAIVREIHPWGQSFVVSAFEWE